jgi:hypothetical protein
MDDWFGYVPAAMARTACLPLMRTDEIGASGCSRPRMASAGIEETPSTGRYRASRLQLMDTLREE